MAQDSQTPGAQTPGSDVLLDTLRRSHLEDAQRQQIWDAYHTQGDEKSFVGALNKLDLNDSVKQTLYDMRYKGFKNLPTNQSANPDAKGEVAIPAPETKVQGDVRPSTNQVFDQRKNAEQTNQEIASFYGRMVPDAAVPYLAAAKKYLVDPFDKMAQVGGQVGSEATEIAAMHLGITGPKGQGVAAGVGELAGGTVADPRMWPFMLEGAAKGALSRLAARGFSTQMLWNAVTKIPEIREYVRQGDDFNAYKAITNAVGSGYLALAGAHENDPVKNAKQVEQIKSDAKDGANVNARMNEIAKQPIGSTPMGPRNSAEQQLQLDFTVKAPDAAHQPHNTSASTVANIERTDPNYVGAVVPGFEPHKFPSRLQGNVGGPIGVDFNPKELIAPKPAQSTVPSTEGLSQSSSTKEPVPVYAGTSSEVPASSQSAVGEGSMSIRKDNLGVKWAQVGDVRVSIPKSISENDIHDYARLKIKEQQLMQQQLRSKPSSFELPQELRGNYDRITKLSRDADLAESDKLADDLNTKKQVLLNQSDAMLHNHVRLLDNDQLGQLRDSSTKEAVQLEAQAKAIKDLTEATIRNRGIKAEIADMRSTGKPVVREVVGQEMDEEGNPRDITQAVKEPAKVSRGARAVFDELQGRVPTSDFNSIKISAMPSGLTIPEWENHVSKLQDARTLLKQKISDAVKLAAESGSSLADQNIEEHVDQLKQVEQLLGKYTEPAAPGRRPNIPAELDEQGAIKAPEQLKSWTIDRARLALGKKVDAIPTDEEFFQHADMRNEKAQMLRRVADVAQKALDQRKKEAGFLGEPGVRGQVKRVSLVDRVPSDEEVLKRANKAGIYGVKIDDQFDSGEYGFLSKDGKIWLDNQYKNHDEVAEAIMPDTPKGDMWTGAPLRAMMEKGWIRKATPMDYEAWSLDKRTIDTIETDLIRHGRHGRDITIDTRKPTGEVRALHLSDGWDDLAKEINAATRRQGWTGSTGAIKGTTLAASSTVGGLVGAVVGAHLGEPYAGMAIGWGAGFVGPAMLDRVGFFNKMAAIKPTLSAFGIKVGDWLAGPKQFDPINPDMKNILDAQRRDIRGPAKALLTRVAQLPADFSRRYIDKFVFISDRPTALGKFLMQGDERGMAFRDLRGKLSVDNSPYVSAWIAAGGGNGWAEGHLLDYKNIYKEAQSGQLVNNLNEYLNLKGYRRVLDVMQERIQEHDQDIAQLTQHLKTPNLPVEVEAGMKKALREAKADRQDIIDRLTNREVVPAPYDGPSINRDLQNLQSTLGPQKFAQVQSLANRVFGLNRKVLDMTHSAGIIGDADYQKYVSRGDEYIPMQRIYDQIANSIEGTSTSKAGSPLYLREQGVIKTLRGSERINRDPVIASADANLEAIREVLRNGVIKDYVRLASADPQGVGSYFKEVRAGHQAGEGKGLVGVYESGQQHTFEVPIWLSESLKNVSPSTMDMVGKWPLRKFASLLRSGATVGNLGWSIPNAIRHWGDMALMSEAGLKEVKTLPKDAAALLNAWRKELYSAAVKDGRYQEYLRSGAAYSTLQRAITPEEHLDLKALGFKQKIASGRVIDTVKDFNATIEDATKMTTYFRLRQAGYSEKAAAWETRRYGGGPDFAKQGMNTGFINLVSMFFNAHLQYVGRAIARAGENPTRMAVALAAVTAMNMALVQHNVSQKDENGNSIWRKVPFTDRENNWVIVSQYKNPITGAPVIAKIPKPSIMKFMSNPIENMLYKMAGAEDRHGSDLALTALSNLLPGQVELQSNELGKSAARGAVSSLNPVLRTPAEEMMNYKTTGSGGVIVPAREQGIDPQFQYGPNASQVYKDIGKGGTTGAVAGAAEGAGIGYLIGGTQGAALGGALGGITGIFGISPRRAEHIIDTTTAGVGRIATGFVDPFLGGVQQTKLGGPADRLVNAPVVGPMVSRFVGSGAIDQQEQTMTQEFYRNAQAAQIPSNTLRFLEKNHPEQVEGYMRQHQNELWKGTVASEMSKRLGQIEDAQRQIQQNQQMSVEDKTAILKQLHGIKLQVLNVFNGVMKPSPQVGQAAAFPGQGQGAPR